MPTLQGVVPQPHHQPIKSEIAGGCAPAYISDAHRSMHIEWKKHQIIMESKLTRVFSKTPSSWDTQDDILLIHLKETLKLGWKEISTHFQNRTPNACQFRWRRLKTGSLKAIPPCPETYIKAPPLEPTIREVEVHAEDARRKRALTIPQRNEHHLNALSDDAMRRYESPVVVPTMQNLTPWNEDEDELLSKRREKELTFAELSILLPTRSESDIWCRIDALEGKRSNDSLNRSTPEVRLLDRSISISSSVPSSNSPSRENSITSLPHPSFIKQDRFSSLLHSSYPSPPIPLRKDSTSSLTSQSGKSSPLPTPMLGRSLPPMSSFPSHYPHSFPASLSQTPISGSLESHAQLPPLHSILQKGDYFDE